MVTAHFQYIVLVLTFYLNRQIDIKIKKKRELNVCVAEPCEETQGHVLQNVFEEVEINYKIFQTFGIVMLELGLY